MTTTTTPAGHMPTYLPDRYDRLRSGAETLASDPAVENADSPLANGESLRAFIETLASEYVLDGLSEHDADTVSMLVMLDFLVRGGWPGESSRGSATIGAYPARTTTPGRCVRSSLRRCSFICSRSPVTSSWKPGQTSGGRIASEPIRPSPRLKYLPGRPCALRGAARQVTIGRYAPGNVSRT